MQEKRGYFITFEGPDGSGKSSAIKALKEYLQNQYQMDVVATREPGGTEIGDQFRDLVHDLRNAGMDERAEIFAYMGSRAQLVAQVILPSLRQGQIVLCDRFTDSTLAYQGWGRGIDIAFLNNLNQVAAQHLVPDLTLLLNIDAQAGLDRRQTGKGEWNRMDAQALEFHQRVVDGYRMMAQSNTARWVTIDASQTKEKVVAEVKDVVVGRLVAVGLLGLEQI